MDRTIIYASIHIDSGGCGLNCTYSEDKPIVDYITEFEEKAINENPDHTTSATVSFIKKTLHHKDGSYQRDDHGDVKTEVIYRHED